MRASCAAMRQSQASASSNPPPTVVPPSSASVTQGKFSERANTRCMSCTIATMRLRPSRVATEERISSRSAPPQNTFSALRRCSIETRPSRSASSSTASTWASSASLIALTGARASVTTSAPPRRSERSSGSVMESRSVCCIVSGSSSCRALLSITGRRRGTGARRSRSAAAFRSRQRASRFL
jgi:hypothetical protein